MDRFYRGLATKTSSIILSDGEWKHESYLLHGDEAIELHTYGDEIVSEGIRMDLMTFTTTLLSQKRVRSKILIEVFMLWTIMEIKQSKSPRSWQLLSVCYDRRLAAVTTANENHTVVSLWPQSLHPSPPLALFDIPFISPISMKSLTIRGYRCG